MSDITIKTNWQARQIIYGYELTETERKEFDYLEGESLDTNSFFRYKGVVYDLGQFFTLERGKNSCFSDDKFAKFDGYMSDSYFSGILVKYTNCGEGVIVARYYS